MARIGLLGPALALALAAALAGPANACLAGWDCCKWNNSTHPQYVVGLILISYPPSPAGLKAALPRINSIYPGTELLPGKDDTLRIACVGVVDLIAAAGSGGRSWQWRPDAARSDCAKCTPGRCEDRAQTKTCGDAVRLRSGEPAHLSHHPTEPGYVYDFNAHRYSPRPRAPDYSATQELLDRWCRIDPEGCEAGRRYGQTQAEQDATSARLAKSAGVAFDPCRSTKDCSAPSNEEAPSAPASPVTPSTLSYGGRSPASPAARSRAPKTAPKKDEPEPPKVESPEEDAPAETED